MSPRASTPATTFQGRWLLIARVAWVVVALLYVGVFISGTPSEFARLQTPCTDAVSCSLIPHLTVQKVQELKEQDVRCIGSHQYREQVFEESSYGSDDEARLPRPLSPPNAGHERYQPLPDQLVPLVNFLLTLFRGNALLRLPAEGLV